MTIVIKLALRGIGMLLCSLIPVQTVTEALAIIMCRSYLSVQLELISVLVEQWQIYIPYNKRMHL